jgi:hypothetical protein
MTDRKATTVRVSGELRELVKPLERLSGLSFSDLVSMGLLQLLGKHRDHLEFGSKRGQVLARMAVEILGEVDRDALKHEQKQSVTVSVGSSSKT